MTLLPAPDEMLRPTGRDLVARISELADPVKASLSRDWTPFQPRKRRGSMLPPATIYGLVIYRPLKKSAPLSLCLGPPAPYPLTTPKQGSRYSALPAL